MHWTYEPAEAIDKTQLFQGDILRRTEELDRVLKGVHPHFADPKYLRFIVLTQSCDLVRRGSVCKAPYITIAVVRDATAAFKAELAQLLKARDDQSLCDGRYVTKKLRVRFDQVAESLLNNNLPDYFFLRADNDAGIEKDLCAFLRVSIALRVDHYDKLLEAKICQITSIFQAKIGWLVGFNYARVGTPDWEKDKKRLAELVATFTENACNWVEPERFQAVQRTLKERRQQDTQDVVAALLADESIMPKPRGELLLKAVADAWGTGETPPQREKFVNKLKSSPEFKLATQGPGAR